MTVGIPRAGALLRGVLAAQLVMLYGPTFAWLIDRWTMSVWHHAHGILISLLVAWLVWRELRNHPELPHGSSAAGYFFVVPSLVLLVLDAGIHTELLSALSLVLLLPGLAFLFLGAERARRILFPLAFLAFTLPIPLSFTEALHLELRQIATAAVAFIVPRLGIPLYTEGTVLHAPSGDLQVADACSGFSRGGLSGRLVVPESVAAHCGARHRRAGGDRGQHPARHSARRAGRVAGRGGARDLVAHDLGPVHLRGRLAGDPVGRARTGAGAPDVISKRNGRVLLFLMALALPPVLVHGWLGLVSDDGWRVTAIPERLDGRLGLPTARNARWGRDIFDTDDWLERSHAGVRLFAARGYDLKRLYHHPELAVLYGHDLEALGVVSLPGRTDAQALLRGGRNGQGLAAMVLYYEGTFITDPVRFQLASAIGQIFLPRAPLTLVMVFDPAAQARADGFAGSAAERVLAAAVAALPAGGSRVVQ